LALLDRVPRMDTRTQVAIEPVIMTMLTTYLLHRSYHMTFPS